ncbi:HAD-IIB family hydrolase [Clostridium sp. D53t1_180928_C8]|uniref:HAD-IIB family hydrolase n=1 Tax=Clostridium sp. D53t1_180928_C8 TaxID=2787101 RepID=UPI0018AC19E2|nr:HAD-IIB family hydrolase [Clostridium sp. D53t1_180928_C8]
MKKLLASDLDGTLVVGNNLSYENKKAILDLNNKNDIFVVSTGRPYNGVIFLEDQHDIKIDYYVLLNGAIILDKNKNTVKHNIIKRETIKSIINFYYKEGIKLSVESGYFTYLLSDFDYLPYDNTKRVNSIEEINEEISLISMYLPEAKIEDIEVIKDNINSVYNNEVIAYRNINYIDIVPIGCSKGNGVKYVVEKENIEETNVYTIGDSWNDISMFEVTDNSFTFHHVEDELKSNVKYVVKSVADCINNFMKK